MTGRAPCATQLCHPPVPRGCATRASWRNGKRADGTRTVPECATPNVRMARVEQQTLCHMASDLRCYTPAPTGWRLARAPHPNPRHRHLLEQH